MTLEISPEILVIVCDITKRKNNEKAMTDSEKKYRTIIENMQDMYYRADLDGNILMISPHGAKLAGYDSPEETIGLNATRDIYLGPGERERFISLLKEKGSVTNHISTLKTKNRAELLWSRQAASFSLTIRGNRGSLGDSS